MFPQRIQRTAFTEPYASGAFKVNGCEVITDAVLMSVLRATLNARLVKTERELTVAFSNTGFNGAYEDGGDDLRTTLRFFEDGGDEINDSDTLTVVNMSVRNIDTRFADSFIAKFGPDGWVRQERISEFFKNSFDILLFTNEEKRSVIVCIANLDASKMHYATCTLFAWFPWYFVKGEVSDEEKNLLQSLRKDRKDDFIKALDAFEDQFDFYSMRLTQLGGVEKSWVRKEAESLRRNIREYDDYVKRYSDEVAKYVKQREAAKMKLVGYELNLEADEGNSIMQFFMDNRDTVILEDSSDAYLTFAVRTYCEFFDPEMADTYINNKRSCLYRGDYDSWNEDDRRQFFTALFIDCTMKLRFCAAYRLNIDNMRVEALGDHTFTRECAGYFPNTHINNYRCLGGYETSLIQAMEACNYCGAIEQAVMSAKSLNFGDSTVMEKFVHQILTTDKPVIEMADGRTVSPREALNILKEEA